MATIKDLESILVLENQVFSVPWSEESIKSELENDVATYFVAEEEGQVIGYSGIWHVHPEGQITNVAVHADYRRRGLGRNLMETLLDNGVKKGITNYYLEVRESNINAINLYKSIGFKEVGRRKNYYKKPNEDALVLALYRE
ncbi:MAG: ribosomal protein S18-alanine N-acetyltransferase [Cellulosilyticaceae bacterium]